MSTLHHAIEAFERVIITGTDCIMTEVANDLPAVSKELTKEQRDLLIYVHIKGTASPGDISKYQGVQKSTMSNRLNKLIRDDYLTYASSVNTDKRYRLVQLTEKGQSFITRSNKVIRHVIEDLFDDLGEKEELETFIKLLAIIQKKIDTKGGTTNYVEK